MKGKGAYGSPLPSPEKPAAKRRCPVNPTPHDTRGPDLARPSETNAHHNSPSDDGPEVGTSSRLAANLNCPTQKADAHDQPNHDTEQSPEAGTSQALVLFQEPPVVKQEDVLIDTSSALAKVRAAGTLLSDWPAYSRGVTEGICDLKTLKRFMTSDGISDDHKAMWVSLVQTIVHEPDQTSVLLRLQNLLSGNSTLSEGLASQPHAFTHHTITRQQWAVTGCILNHASEKPRWSAAHLLDLALWVGGPNARVQAARAFRIFGVWDPSGDFEPEFSISSIRTCLDAEAILRKIWPSGSAEQEHIISRANHHPALTDHRFANFKDVHSYLLRQCVGQDLASFSPLSRDAAVLGDVSNRIISKAYFDSTLAPLLVEHFDADVDLLLAYYAAVQSQDLSIDRSPVKCGGPLKMSEPQPLPRSDTKCHRDNGKTGKGKSTRTAFHPDDHKDDSEPETEQGNDTRQVLHFPETQQLPQVHRQTGRWTSQENDACLEMVRQVLLSKRDKKLRWHKVEKIAERLRTEHHINRSSAAIWARWRADWRHLPEFKKGDANGNGVSPVHKDGRREWDDTEVKICLELMRQLMCVEGDKTSVYHKCDQISKRLKTEHKTNRPRKSIYHRWRTDWCYRPEFKSLLQKGDNDDINKRNGRHQEPHGFEEGEEEQSRQYEHEDDGDEEHEDEEDEQEEDSAQSDTSSRGNSPEHSAQKDATDHEAVDDSHPRTKSQNEQVSHVSKLGPRVTRAMSKSDARDKRTTNNLFQQSRNISLDVISRYIDSGKSKFTPNWKQIVKHREDNRMEASASKDNSPFPLEEVLDGTATSAKPRNGLEKTGVDTLTTLGKNRVELIEEEVKDLRRFAKSAVK